MVLWIPLSYLSVSPTRLSLPSVGFPTPFGYRSIYYIAVRNPVSISTLGLASFAFARHYSQNLGWFLFLPVLRCFSSRGSPRNAMYLRYVSWLFTMSVSTFGNLRISLFAAPRSLSQLITSFFGSWCQGIHLMLLFAWTFLSVIVLPITWFSSFSELLEFHKTFFRLFPLCS